MASLGDYKLLLNKWLNKTHTIGSPELDALINISNVPKTAYRDLSVSQSTPVIKGSSQYGLLDEVVTITAGGGEASSVDSLFHCETGTLPGGIGIISLDGTLPFRPGQGEKSLFTARFSAGQVLMEQFAGATNATSGAGWGYNGVDFGLLVRSGGAIEIQDLTITTPASGNETAVIEIDGVSYNVPLTSGTAQENATEIALSLTAQSQLWFFTQVDNQVIVQSLVSTPSTGVFTFTSASAVGSFELIATGNEPVNNWLKQEDWNGEDINELDPNFLNSYKIQLGSAVAYFSILSQVTGEYVLVHTLNVNNSNTKLLIENPTFGHSWYALSRGGTNNVVTEGGFAGLYREGLDIPPRATQSINGEGNTNNTMIPLFSLKVRGSINGVVNEANAIIRAMQIASDSTKPIVATLIADGDLVGTNWQYVDKNNSILLIDRSATAVSGGKQLKITGFQTINSASLASILQRDKVFTLAVNTSSGGPSADFTGVLTYLEDL